MNVSRNTRPYRAGRLVADALCETAHILYLTDNRLLYLQGIKDSVVQELESAGVRVGRRK